MALIPDETIERILERIDIVELASRYMSLKRSGVNNMGCCPFHDEKSPSFNVNSSRQRYHCFGCKADGHAIGLLMHFEGLNFREACKRLAAEAGIEIEERRDSPEEELRRQERERLQRVNAVAAEFFHRLLLNAPEAASARSYLRRRGYDGEAAREFQLGYAPDRWDALVAHLREEGINPEDARNLGLIRPRDNGSGDFDMFRGRLIFPIHDLSGRIVAFGGRILGEGQPKYINSSESPIYHKGQVLYGLYAARQEIRKSSEVILVEGYFDQLALTRAGIANSVATCGTALTSEHAQLLKRYAGRVLLLFDNDSAGRNATFKAMELLLPTGMETVVVELEAGEDPDSFLHKRGIEAFDLQRREARPALEVYMQEQLAQAQGGAAGISRAAQQVLEVLALLPNPLELDLCLKELARQSGIEADLLRQQLDEVRQDQRQRKQRQQERQERQRVAVPPELPPPPPENAPPVAAPVERRRKPRLIPADAKLLKLLIFETEVRQLVEGEGVEAFFYEPLACELARELVELLRGVAEGGELDRLRQVPELFERLPQPLEYDPAEYAGDGRKMLESYRRKTADRRRRQRLKGDS